MTPGHQVVGTVVREGAACRLGLLGQRVGVAWIYGACGACRWCLQGRENLCPEFRACGRDAAGGYAEYMTVPEAFAHRIPEGIGDLEATPLLCAGAVGIRALRLCRLENGQALGLTGFGASGHLVLQMANHLYPDSPVHVFARAAAEREGSAEDRLRALITAVVEALAADPYAPRLLVEQVQPPGHAEREGPHAELDLVGRRHTAANESKRSNPCRCRPGGVASDGTNVV